MLAQQRLPFPDEDFALEGTPSENPEEQNDSLQTTPHVQSLPTEKLAVSNGNGNGNGNGSALKAEEQFGLNLLALGKVKGIGIHTLRALLDQYESLAQVWDTDEEDLHKILTAARVKDSAAVLTQIQKQRTPLLEAAWRQLQQLRNIGVHILNTNSNEYPRQLKDLSGAPYWLFVQGNTSVLNSSLVAIVGTRTPTQAGRRAATRLAGIVAEEGFGIVSGLADGIDDAAHRMGLLYGVPQVAVLGTGIDQIFPASTSNTREAIVATGGAIISEYLPGDRYQDKVRFIERNRIQAGLAVAVAPVESKRQSGTAHTIRFAEKYGRPLFGAVFGGMSPENEVIDVLIEQHHPLFDLSNSAQVERLRTWLYDKGSAENRPHARYQLDRQKLFQGVLQPLEDISKFMPLTLEDKQWLLMEMAKQLGIEIVMTEGT